MQSICGELLRNLVVIKICGVGLQVLGMRQRS
jgi:hypothetical protein